MRPVFDKTFRIGKRFSVRFTVPQPDPDRTVAILTEWTPAEPINALSRSEMRAFMRARQKVLEALSKHFSGVAACVDMMPKLPPLH